MGWLLALVAISHQAQTGRIQVAVVDPTGARIEAQIQIVNLDSGEIVANGELPSGRYQLKTRMNGFRTQVLDGIQVEAGRTTELPPVTMRFASCGSPGIQCLDIGPAEKRDAWHETLRAGCAIDLDGTNKKKCATEETADLRVEVQDQKMYFVAAGGARFSEVNPESPEGPFATDRIRVDNLGSGFDMSVKTKRGKVVAIFFTAEVAKGDSKIPVYFVAISK